MPENQNPVFTDESLSGDGTEENPLSVAASGSITEIESTDDSIEVTDGTGPVVDLSVNGPAVDATLGDNCVLVVVDNSVSPPKLRRMVGWNWAGNGTGYNALVVVPFAGGGGVAIFENQSGGIIFQCGAGAGAGTGAGTWTLSQNGDMRLAGTHINFSDGAGTVTLQIFANNAAALLGGLNVGDLYRTGADPDVVCIVH